MSYLIINLISGLTVNGGEVIKRTAGTQYPHGTEILAERITRPSKCIEVYSETVMFYSVEMVYTFLRLSRHSDFEFARERESE